MADSICRRCFHSYVCEQFNEHRDSENDKCHFFNDHFVPAVEVEPVKHGRWEPRKDALGFVCCSVCHDCNIYDDWADGKKWNYCPNCGAKMDLEG